MPLRREVITEKNNGARIIVYGKQFMIYCFHFDHLQLETDLFYDQTVNQRIEQSIIGFNLYYNKFYLIYPWYNGIIWLSLLLCKHMKLYYTESDRWSI